MDNPLRPGSKGESLPSGVIIFRLVAVSKDGPIAVPAHFELSSIDKEAIPPSLSVWAEKLTTPEEAREFRGPKRDVSRLVLYLDVDRVRTLRPEPDSPDAPYLDVVWEPLSVEEGGWRAGAAGHAGIINLKHANMNKAHYKSLRSQLADLANEQDPYLLPE